MTHSSKNIEVKDVHDEFRSQVSPLSMFSCQRVSKASIIAAEGAPENRNTPWGALRNLGITPISGEKTLAMKNGN